MAETLISRTRPADQPQSRPRPTWRRTLPLVLVSLPMPLFLLLPIVALLLRVAPADLLANLVDREVAQAISLSVVTTLMTTLLVIVFGTPTAYLLARRRFRGRTIVDTLIDLPMLLPPSVAGIALLMAFGRRGLIGSYLSGAEIEIAFTRAAVVLA